MLLYTAQLLVRPIVLNNGAVEAYVVVGDVPASLYAVTFIDTGCPGCVSTPSDVPVTFWGVVHAPPLTLVDTR